MDVSATGTLLPPSEKRKHSHVAGGHGLFPIADRANPGVPLHQRQCLHPRIIPPHNEPRPGLDLNLHLRGLGSGAHRVHAGPKDPSRHEVRCCDDPRIPSSCHSGGRWMWEEKTPARRREQEDRGVAQAPT
jgi:hypothetical protein